MVNSGQKITITSNISIFALNFNGGQRCVTGRSCYKKRQIGVIRYHNDDLVQPAYPRSLIKGYLFALKVSNPFA